MAEGIFNSPELTELIAKNDQGIFDRCPHVIYLAQSEDLAGERRYLEELIGSAPAQKQKKWIKELIQQNDEQHLSAWFEIMLYGWLKQAGSVEVEPDILGNSPDFSFTSDTATEPVIIEARAVLKTENARFQSAAISRVFKLLEQVPMPYVVTIKSMHISSLRLLGKLVHCVSMWLKEDPDNQYIYEDGKNTIVLTARPHASQHVYATYVPPGSFINPNVLKPAMRQKANQHTAIRHAGYPYVIALFLENSLFSVEEVFQAWIGNTVYTLDTQSGDLLDTHIDCSGLSFHKMKVQDRSVSGFLVCHVREKVGENRRMISGVYVQNPYATSVIDWKCFPVEAAYVVEDRRGLDFAMNWVIPPSPEGR